MTNSKHSKKMKPWQVLKQIVDSNSFDSLDDFTGSLSRDELIHALFKLSQSDQEMLISNLSPSNAAELIEDIPISYAADVLEHIQPSQAASIVTELASDERVDLLKEIEDEEAEKILGQMEKDDAERVRSLIDYPSDVAGGLMMTEFLSYPKHYKASQVVKDLTERPDDYALYNVQYLYVVHAAHQLFGVLRLRDLVFSDPEARIEDLAIEAKVVLAQTNQDELHDFFEENEISACPVVDENNTLLGVIRKSAIDTALSEKAELDHQKSQGIINGEELRSMPTLSRSKRRLSWLSVNIVLNICAASIIAMYEDTLTSVIALAVFLPIVSDMSGCSGNQSIAVSMREITLGISRPSDMFRVWLKEVSVGAINGLVLGVLLGLLTWVWKDNVFLGLVVGTALCLNTMIAVSIGGVVPLLLKKFKIDPAVASGPVLTTITDMCGFFLVLGFATIMLSKLV